MPRYRFTALCDVTYYTSVEVSASSEEDARQMARQVLDTLPLSAWNDAGDLDPEAADLVLVAVEDAPPTASA